MKTIYYLVSEEKTFEGTGIDRVVKSMLNSLKLNFSKDYNIIAVYFSSTGSLIPSKLYNESFSKIVEPHNDDIILSYDIVYNLNKLSKEKLLFWKKNKIKLVFLLHDLIPIRRKEWFSGESVHVERVKYFDDFKSWVDFIMNNSSLILCISKTVLIDVKKYLSEEKISRKPKVDYNYSGYDIQANNSTKGLPNNYKDEINKIKSKISFLMVGTLEPRKSHKLALDIFSKLWSLNYDVSLVIAGRAGKPWMSKYTENLINNIQNHKELNNKLFFIESPSDEYLDLIYKSSTSLLMLSEDEGFGLPLIEASNYNLPLIVRDISIFRELCEGSAYFLNIKDVESVVKQIIIWIKLNQKSKHIKSNDMKKVTWNESSKMLIKKLIKNEIL